MEIVHSNSSRDESTRAKRAAPKDGPLAGELIRYFLRDAICATNSSCAFFICSGVRSFTCCARIH